MENNNVMLLLCVLLLFARTEAIFTCRTTGRFPDLTDLTCRRYFHCSRSFGTLWGTPYRCANSNFDPNTQKCSTTYPCRTAPISTDLFKLFPPQFTCTSSGIFPDLEDSSCKRYFRCVKLLNVLLYKVAYNCQNSMFDPVLRKCSENYDCQKNNPLLSTGTQFNSSDYSTSITFSTTTEELLDMTSTNSSSELTETTSTTKYSIDVLLKISSIMPSEMTSFEEVAKTEKYNKNNDQDMKGDEKTSFQLNTTIKGTEEPLQSTTGFESITTSEEILTETTSTNYDNMAELIPVSTTIQNISVVDLNDSSYSTKSHLEAFTEHSTLSVTEIEYDDSRCTYAGKFPDLEDETCSRYFLCSSLRNGTILKTTYHCPNSTFDPFLKRCSKLRQCEPGKTTPPNSSVKIFTFTETEILPIIEHTTVIGLDLNYEMDTETVQTETEGRTISNIEEYVCPEAGKFPDLTDHMCQKYYHCDKLKDETFIQTVHVCPNSTFDPMLQKCSKYYDCPQLQSTATSIITTMFTTKTEVQTRTVENFATESSSTVYDFQCSQAGRFPDLNDFTCKCYFLCNRLRNGTFVQTPYECPSNSIFDPLIQLCSTHTACSYQINYYTV